MLGNTWSKIYMFKLENKTTMVHTQIEWLIF